MHTVSPDLLPKPKEEQLPQNATKRSKEMLRVNI
jgi:hypothetical protein